MTTHGPFVADLATLLASQGSVSYREALRVPALSLGLFSASEGHDDTQTPHTRDEVYVVMEGSAVLVVGGERTAVSAGSVAYVPAGVSHRFAEIDGDLRVVVVFAPPTDA